MLIRRPAILLILLAAGSVENIVIAWGAAYWSRPALQRPASLGSIAQLLPPRSVQDDLVRIEYRGFGMTLRTLRDPKRAAPPPPTHGQEEVFGISFDAPWDPDEWPCELHAGWPARSLQCQWPDRWPFNPTPAERYSTGIATERPLNGTNEPMRRRLPLKVLWPGFLMDSSLYALQCWLLLETALKLRRGRLMRKGLCPACKYPVGSSPVCTECGTPVRLRPRTSAARP